MRYQNRAAELPPSRLVELGFIDGVMYDNGQTLDTYGAGTWRN